MRVLDVLVALRQVHDRSGLVAELRRAEGLGAAGVLLSDHVAGPFADVGPLDPYTMLGAAGALSDRLTIGTLVANVSILHPALAARHFLQLALLYGGDRIVAGIGAGWHGGDFHVLGEALPAHRQRTERLAEAAHVMRQMFDTGHATLQGRHVRVDGATAVPAPTRAPQLLVGGGSRDVLAIGARTADRIDLNAPSGTGRRDHRDPRAADRIRRLTTTLADLEAAVAFVSQTAAGAGRDPAQIRFSMLLSRIVLCRRDEVEAAERRVCEAAGLPWRRLDQCPYVLIGEPGVLRDRLRERADRLPLSTVVVPNGSDLEGFMSQVMP